MPTTNRTENIMLELGKVQTLQAVKKVEFGMYFAALDDKKGEERVLLPAKQVPKGMARIGLIALALILIHPSFFL